MDSWTRTKRAASLYVQLLEKSETTERQQDWVLPATGQQTKLLHFIGRTLAVLHCGARLLTLGQGCLDFCRGVGRGVGSGSEGVSQSPLGAPSLHCCHMEGQLLPILLRDRDGGLEMRKAYKLFPFVWWLFIILVKIIVYPTS